MNKPVLQNASDTINGTQYSDADTIQITKSVASLYRKTVEAIEMHKENKDKQTEEKESPIVTMQAIKDAMNRGLIDEGLDL